MAMKLESLVKNIAYHFIGQDGKQILEVLVLGCGIITFAIWLAICINRKKEYGKHYTRIMLPSFVFILCADIFFTIISVFQGGVFRGWFSKKKPTVS